MRYYAIITDSFDVHPDDIIWEFERYNEAQELEQFVGIETTRFNVLNVDKLNVNNIGDRIQFRKWLMLFQSEIQ